MRGLDPSRNGRGPQSPNQEFFWDVDSDTPLDIAICGQLAFENLLSADGNGESCLCEGLDADPQNDPCQRAIKQTTALLLNFCSGILDPDICLIDVSAQGCNSTTPGELLLELDLLIASGDCQVAASCAAEVNEGNALTGGSILAPAFEEPTNDTRDGRGERTKPLLRDQLGESDASPTPRAARNEVEAARASATEATLDVVTADTSSKELRQATDYVLLTGLTTEQTLEARLRMAEELIDRGVDVGMRDLVEGHLVDVRDEAKALSREKLSRRAEELLGRLDAQ